MRNKGLVAVAIATLAASSTAQGADLRERLAPSPPALHATSDWNGFYLGALGGYSFGRTGTALLIDSATLAPIPGMLATIEKSGTGTLQPSGGVIGATFGYNHQVSPLFVVGIEGDVFWSGMRTTVASGGAIPVLGGSFAIKQSLQTDWQGTLRGRVGMTPMDRVLVFATGGLAVANVRYTAQFLDTFQETEYTSRTSTQTGWTIGGGLEAMVTPNWSLKVEYLHTEFPSQRMNGYSVLVDSSIATTAHSAGTARSDAIRAGLNYHFTTSDSIIARY